MKKSAVLSSVFTPALTKALKSHRCPLHCQTAGDHVYITNGQILVKLTPEEYDEFIRPVSRRDPGSWVLDENGQPMTREPIDAARTLADYAGQNCLSSMIPAPFTIQPEDKKAPAFKAYHSAAGDFTACFDPGYTAVVSACQVTFRGCSATSPMLAYAGEDPVAVLLPLRIRDARMTAAALAYFTGDRPEGQTKTAALDPRLSAALEEVERLREELKQAKACAAPEQPANKAAAVLAALESLEGITATVKGAQTSSPVVWVGGNAEAHKAALEKMGAKWSGKRSAYYIQAA